MSGDNYVCRLDKGPRGRQRGGFRPMPTIGSGVEEVRTRDDAGNYRVIYTARLADAIFVLHAFQKKTQRTSQRDLSLRRPDSAK